MKFLAEINLDIYRRTSEATAVRRERHGEKRGPRKGELLVQNESDKNDFDVFIM